MALSNTERQRRWYKNSDGEVRRAQRRKHRMDTNSTREFIAWDGEGVNHDGPGKPQSYVLFGASTGDYVTRRDGGTLTFGDCAELILRVGRAKPTAWHVGFAFDYDVNQIVRTLPYRYLEWLNERGTVKYGPYRLHWRRGKSFTLSCSRDGTTQSVTIYDVFSFFATSFVKALRAILGNDERYRERVTFVEKGKARRKQFTLGELDNEIFPYWQEEIGLLAVLVSQFRDLLYAADFPITQWYGPGAIASLVLNRMAVRNHMAVPPTEVIEAAQFAYAGGRFEHFRVGRSPGPIWSIDINSAYPHALSQLPSLANGTWIYRPLGKSFSEIPRKEIHSFAIYHVELSHPQWRQPWYPNTPPGPLFFRTPKGEMRYPWHVKGWYWGPEIENLCHPRIAPYAYAIGVWEFIEASENLPFQFITGMYSQRQEWKRTGKAEQLALKLAMNSIYGKLAQRIGWEQKGDAPTFHQLEWAGWVTSYVRAELFRTLWQLGNDIISVETDGIYTSRDPATIGIEASSDLGGWTVTRYEEILYLQSGTYFARDGDEWISKYRGLDPSSLTVDKAIEYLQGITEPASVWPKLAGTTTRYIGLSAAMVQGSGIPAKFRNRHGVWDQDKDRELAPGTGKRQHYPDSCVECAKGISPYDMGHYMGVGIELLPDGINESTRHFLPWKDGKVKDEQTAWRKTLRYEQGKLFEH